MRREDFPAPREGFVVAHYLAVADKSRSTRFYSEILGRTVVHDGGEQGVTIVQLANMWLVLHTGEGPTADKPDVVLAPPADPTRMSSFLEIRVASIREIYAEWTARGARFLTEPHDRGSEIRCFMRDPDGHLIEVGEATGVLGELE